MPLSDALRLAGADARPGVAYRTGLGDILTVRVPGAEAFAVWERLRASVSDAGHWPVLCQALDEDRDPDDWATVEASTIRRDLLHGDELDVPEWFSTHARPDPVELASEPLASLFRTRGRELDAAGESGLADGLSVLECRDGDETTTPELVSILLVPTAVTWHVPAFLQLGFESGEPDMPSPHEHVAILKHWHERWGAELVSFVGHNVVELRPSRRPTSSDAATLAREIHAYCPHTVETLSFSSLSQARLAEHLKRAPFWHFWWE